MYPRFTRRLILVFALLLQFISGVTFSFAQDGQTQSLSQRGLVTAKRLELASETLNNKSLELSGYRNEKEQHFIDRLEIYSGFDGSGNADFLNTIRTYKNYALEVQDQEDINLSNLFEELAQIYNPYEVDKNGKINDAIAYLDNFIMSENWEIAHSAMALTAVFEGHMSQTFIPIQLTPS